MASCNADEAAVAATGNADGDEAAPAAEATQASPPKAPKRVSPGRDTSRPNLQPLTCEFRPFTRESLQRIQQRIEEEEKAKQLAKELKENPPGADEVDGLPTIATPMAGGATDADKNVEKEDKPQPNPLFEAGKQLLPRFGKFPPELYGKPIEDLDEFYHNKYVSIGIGSILNFTYIRATVAKTVLNDFQHIQEIIVLISLYFDDSCSNSVTKLL
jgi:hypothetical protein